METPDSLAPADTFMERLREHPEFIEVLLSEGIVIEAAEGDTVTADFWHNNNAKDVGRKLACISRKLGVEVRFDLRARG